MILLLILYLASAGSFTISKAVLAYSNPLFFLAVRMLMAGLLLLGFYRWHYGPIEQVRKNWKSFALVTLFHIYLAFALDLYALQYMSSSKAAFLFNISPFLSALFSYIYFHERMTFMKLIGLIIGFLGFLPELIIATPQEGKSLLFISWAEFFMLLSVVSTVFGWVLFRKLVKQQYSPILINGVSKCAGGLLSFITYPFIEGFSSPVSDWPAFIQLTIFIVLLVNILFYNLYGYLLKKYTATFLSFGSFLVPFLAALLGWLFLGEKVHSYFFFSLFIVSIGLLLFYYEELKQGYIVE